MDKYYTIYLDCSVFGRLSSVGLIADLVQKHPFFIYCRTPMQSILFITFKQLQQFLVNCDFKHSFCMPKRFSSISLFSLGRLVAKGIISTWFINSFSRLLLSHSILYRFWFHYIIYPITFEDLNFKRLYTKVFIHLAKAFDKILLK